MRAPMNRPPRVIAANCRPAGDPVAEQSALFSSSLSPLTIERDAGVH
jgi:hypothetical protein